MASKKTVKASARKAKKTVSLSSKVEAFLAKNTGKTFTYNQVAKKLKVKAVAVANATRTLRKLNPVIASSLITARTNTATTTTSVKA